MNPLVSSLLTAVLRHILNSVGVWCVAQGIVKPDQAEQMVVGIVASTVALVWSFYSKYSNKVMENTRAAMPQGTTLQEAVEMIAEGRSARAMTGANETPRLKEAR